MSLQATLDQVQEETEEILTGPPSSAYLNNSSFSKLTPKLQIALDSTSIAALKKCPRYYEYTIVEGYSWGGTATNPHLVFGTVFHKADEIYHLQRAEGLDHDQALILALRYTLEATFDLESGLPWLSDEPTKTRATLLRTVVWYLDHFKDQNLTTLILASGKAAVELSFRIVIGDLAEGPASETFMSPDGEAYILCGHLDRVAELNGEIFITDKKTSKFALDDQYFKQFSPNIQVTVYSIAGLVTFKIPVAGLIIDGCQILVNGSRFKRQLIYRTSNQLEEFLFDLQFYLRELEMYAKADHYPLRETSCGFGKMQCQFRQVCSADPSVRHDLLESLFTRRVWDPLTPR